MPAEAASLEIVSLLFEHAAAAPGNVLEHIGVGAARADQSVAAVLGRRQCDVVLGESSGGRVDVFGGERRTIGADDDRSCKFAQCAFKHAQHSLAEISPALQRQLDFKILGAGLKK